MVAPPAARTCSASGRTSGESGSRSTSAPDSPRFCAAGVSRFLAEPAFLRADFFRVAFFRLVFSRVVFLRVAMAYPTSQYT